MHVVQSIALVMLLGSIGITLTCWVLSKLAWHSKYLGAKTLVITDAFGQLGVIATLVSLIFFLIVVW